MKKWLLRIGIGIGVLVLGVVITGVILDEPVPEGQTGPEAEALAHRIESAVNRDGWERTGAVRWTFALRDHHHLWDRERDLVQVRWDDNEVLITEGGGRGRAFVSGREVTGAEARELREQAYAYFINDGFWLNPVVKLFDPGVTRRLVHADGQDALLITYASGGRTPGDSYLWFPGPDGVPVRWKMWVSVLPIGGVEVSWDRWVTLATGAKVSTLHEIGPMTLEITDVEAAATLAELEPGPDPFARMLEE